MKLGNKTTRAVIGILAVIVLLACVVFALPVLIRIVVYLARLFMPFLIAYIFSLIVDPIVRKLQTYLKLPRNVTALVVIILLIGVAGGIVSWVGHKIISEIRVLFNNLPQIYENLLDKIETIKTSLSGFYEILPQNIQQSLSEITTQFTQKISELINLKSLPFVTGAGSVAKSIPKALISFIVFILSTFFMISDLERVKTVVKKPFSENVRSKFTLISEQIKTYIGGYIKAQGTIMLVVFFILLLSLSLLRVDFALLIALGTAFLDALPFFGSGAVLWPWSLISFISGDIRMGVCTIVTYVVILVVRQLIEPKIVSRNIGTNPLLTLISMYLGYRLLSVGGMILGPLIMLFIISLHRAGIFEVPTAFIKILLIYIKKQCIALKTKILSFWESE